MYGLAQLVFKESFQIRASRLVASNKVTECNTLRGRRGGDDREEFERADKDNGTDRSTRASANIQFL